jgi:hypothetical protein
VELAIPGQLRVKVPCDDERDYFARLADHVAQRGLRVPTEHQRPIGTRLQVALEFRNGEVLRGDAVVDAHVQLDTRSGVNVRFLHLERAERRAPPPVAPAPPLPAAPPWSGLAPATPLAGAPLDDDHEVLPSGDPLVTSGEVAASVHRRVARIQRATLAVVALAAVFAAGGYAVARHLGIWITPEARVAALVRSADRCLLEGRPTGKDGALEHLLAAKRLRPDDAATNARLTRLADMFEGLGGRALERGDLPVASIHLETARLAAPDRASIRAKQDALAEKNRPREKRPEAAPRPQRKRAGNDPKSRR